MLICAIPAKSTYAVHSTRKWSNENEHSEILDEKKRNNVKCPFAPCTPSGRAQAKTGTPDHPDTPAQHNPTNMTPIDNAVKDLELRDKVNLSMYQEVRSNMAVLAVLCREDRGASRAQNKPVMKRSKQFHYNKSYGQPISFN
jgi:hypothetical protein